MVELFKKYFFLNLLVSHHTDLSKMILKQNGLQNVCLKDRSRYEKPVI